MFNVLVSFYIYDSRFSITPTRHSQLTNSNSLQLYQRGFVHVQMKSDSIVHPSYFHRIRGYEQDVNVPLYNTPSPFVVELPHTVNNEQDTGMHQPSVLTP